MLIARKIGLGYAAMSLLVAAVGAVGYHAVTTVDASFDQAINQTQPVLSALFDLRFASTRLLGDLDSQSRAERTGDATALIADTRKPDTADLKEIATRYQSIVDRHFPHEAPRAKAIVLQAHRFSTSANKLTDSGGHRPAERLASLASLHADNEDLLVLVAEAIEHEQDEFTEYKTEVAGIVRNQATIVLLISLGSFLAALTLGGLIARRLAAPIRNIRDAAAHIGRGHFQDRVAVPKSLDEVHDLAVEFNQMVARLGDTLVARDFVEGIIASMSESLVVIDSDAVIQHHNAALVELAGLPAGSNLRGREMVDVAFAPEQLRNILTHRDSGQRSELEISPIGSAERHVSISASSIQGDNAEAGTVLHILDVSQRKANEQRMYELANYDAVTGLPNRNLAMALLSQSLSRLSRGKTHLAVLFCDLDRFKIVNDTYGHAAGDRVLQQVAGRLEASVRPGDIVARLGGDEYLVILNALAHITDIAGVAAKIVETISSPLRIDDDEIFVSASIGISISPTEGLDAEVLLKNADLAMYAAKAAGKSRFCFFDAQMRERSEQRLNLEMALRRALNAGDQLEVYFQPQTGMAGNLIGFEALVRWNHTELGLLQPATFLPLAAEAGLMAAIDEAVLRASAAAVRRWREAGHTGVRVAVNMSDQSFRRADLFQLVASVLAENAIPAAALELELTESVIMDNIDNAISKMHEIAALGVAWSIDDFGTGYSSLAQLKRCPVTTLKIDRSFIRNLSHDASDAAITETIVALAHRLGMSVMAEGVETVAQLRQLDGFGCDAIQGYLLSVPVPAEALPALIARLRDHPPAASGAPAPNLSAPGPAGAS